MTKQPLTESSTLPDGVRYSELDRLFLLGMRYLSCSIEFHDRVSSVDPRIAALIYSGTATGVRAVLTGFRKLVPTKYTDADPYKSFSADPNNIRKTTGEPFSKRRGWVVDGNWDRQGQKFMDRVCPKAIKQHTINGLEWDETILADHYTGEKYQRRRERIENIYNSIRAEGYQSQRELLSQNPDTAWNGLNDAMHPLANEIAVDIGRNGELLWNMCGQHRLAIAKVLEVDEVYVQVFRRHAEWQEIREKARMGSEVPPGVRNHPDLRDIKNDD